MNLTTTGSSVNFSQNSERFTQVPDLRIASETRFASETRRFDLKQMYNDQFEMDRKDLAHCHFQAKQKKNVWPADMSPIHSFDIMGFNMKSRLGSLQD